MTAQVWWHDVRGDTLDRGVTMRAVIVSVNYGETLAQTLPLNRHHFDEVLVITDQCRNLDSFHAKQNHCKVWVTDAFTRRGELFNKWAALEEGLTEFKREGWLCLLDADIVLPQDIHLFLEFGKLYSPLRHMHDTYSPTSGETIPPEKDWGRYRVHTNTSEWAGYCQIFHAEDPVLGPPPWHELDWVHAGGADSFFQRKWKVEDKVRPPFKVLHLGKAGENWCGTSEEGRAKLREFFALRRRTKNFLHEKRG